MKKMLLLIPFFLLGIIWVIIYVNKHKFDKHNEEQLAKIKTVNPNAYKTFSAFIADIQDNTKYIVYIQSSYRSYAEQEKLHREDSFNAKPGRSKHNKGLAIDFNAKSRYVFNDGWLKKSNYEGWKQSGIIEISKKYNLFWGGNFKLKKDCVHFEIR